MVLRISLVFILIFCITSCSKLADAAIERELEEMQAEIAELTTQVEQLTEQLEAQKALHLKDSNKRRNENIRSLFARE